jgi:nitrate reductase beta subunit
MRSFMRSVNLGIEPDPSIAPSVRLEPEEIEAMYRLLAIAKYEHRYVIPHGATSQAHELDSLATGCSLDTDGGPGMTAFDTMVEKFHLTDTNGAAPEAKSNRINLLNWDGRSTDGLLPSAHNGNGANGHDTNGSAKTAAATNGSATIGSGPTTNGATKGSVTPTPTGASK